jgi:acyl dehydratase
MIARFAVAVELRIAGSIMQLNYGFDKVRMVSPVSAGKRIRGCFVLRSLLEREPGQWLTTLWSPSKLTVSRDRRSLPSGSFST